MDAWSFWNKEEKPVVTYTYYPLWCLHQFYRRYEMYDNAIRVSDEIVKFITEKEGPNYPILAEEVILYPIWAELMTLLKLIVKRC